MTDELSIRPAALSDLDALMALYRQLDPDDPATDPDAAGWIFDRLARYAGSTVLLGTCGNAAVTTCTLIVIPNLTRGGAPYALIENVVTDAPCRRRGFGQAILKEAVARAWRNGCYKVMLLTGSADPATHSFYEGVGFAQSKTGYQMRRGAADPR